MQSIMLFGLFGGGKTKQACKERKGVVYKRFTMHDGSQSRCRRYSPYAVPFKNTRVLKNREGYEQDTETGRWVKKCAAGKERFVKTGRCRQGAYHGPITKRAFKLMANKQLKKLIAKRARKGV